MNNDPYDPQWDDPPPVAISPEPAGRQRIVVNNQEVWVDINAPAPVPAPSFTPGEIAPDYKKQRTLQIAVSLEEPVRYLKSNVQMLVPRHLDYNYGPFFTKLLDEIFAWQDSSTTVRAAQSTQILLSDGVEERRATKLAYDVFQQVLDYVSTAVPAMAFGHREGLQYGFCEPWDLLIYISPQYLESFEQGKNNDQGGDSH